MTGPDHGGRGAGQVGAAEPGTTAGRAAAAERAVLRAHLRRPWGVPGLALALVQVPPRVRERVFVDWSYWWQAHLLDCLVDAQLREPTAQRQRQVQALVRGHRVRNGRGWTNDYYDDMAWLALALLRADRHVGAPTARAVRTLTGEVRAAWDAAPAGGVPWRRGDDYRNAPANGPAAVLLARTGDVQRAGRVLDWVHDHLVDPATGLVLDGVHDGAEPDRTLYTYCQGTVLGAAVELARRTDETRQAERACRLVHALAEHLAPDGVLVGAGSTDGGLFAGITARYLALAATRLPGAGQVARAARATAERLVSSSAQAAWQHRDATGGEPRFGAEWSRPAAAGAPPELSYQVSGWMVLEAAARLDRELRPPRRP